MSSTANPRHPNNPPSDPPSEPTGPVAKDSLANESIQRGGGFGENTNPEVLGVKGASSTLNNTDTSGAEILHPASSGAAREAQDARGLGKDERGEAGGVKYPDKGAGQGFEGTTSDQGYVGGSTYGGTTTTTTTTATTSGGSSTAAAAAVGGGIRPKVDAAPNYAADATTTGDLKPKGDNLVEGGDIPPNRSTYTGDVGGPKDPGRLAEREFAKVSADSSGGLGARDYSQQKGGDGSVYDALNSSERA